MSKNHSLVFCCIEFWNLHNVWVGVLHYYYMTFSDGDKATTAMANPLTLTTCPPNIDVPSMVIQSSYYKRLLHHNGIQAPRQPDQKVFRIPEKKKTNAHHHAYNFLLCVSIPHSFHRGQLHNLIDGQGVQFSCWRTQKNI